MAKKTYGYFVHQDKGKKKSVSFSNSLNELEKMIQTDDDPGEVSQESDDQNDITNADGDSSHIG